MFNRANREELPPFQFNLKTIGSRPRPIEERQLSFTLDTTSIDAGSMSASLQNWPGITDAVENMAIMLPFHRLTQLAQARAVHGRLGETPFVLSARNMADFRSLLVAALCYASQPD